MAEPTRIGLAQADQLVQVHDHLRGELTSIFQAVDQVAAGAADPEATRIMINAMSLRQNYWTLGSFCAQYCTVVAMHHGIEDAAMFPGLRGRQPSLAPVLDRLSAEHLLVHDALVALDDALVSLVDRQADVEGVRVQAQRLADVLLPHLSYEEEQLLPVLGRLTDRLF